MTDTKLHQKVILTNVYYFFSKWRNNDNYKMVYDDLIDTLKESGCDLSTKNKFYVTFDPLYVLEQMRTDVKDYNKIEKRLEYYKQVL